MKNKKLFNIYKLRSDMMQICIYFYFLKIDFIISMLMNPCKKISLPFE